MAIADIVRIAERVLEAIGRDCPKGFTESFADELTKQYGGSRMYFPCGLTPQERAERDASIRREFNGRNIKQICEKYRVKRTRVYEIVNTK